MKVNLIRLFQNLISNAVKYRGEDPLEIHVTAEERGPEWVIRIEDNGLGIPPQNHARVFMPFIRLANRNVPATGLGLAVCKKIVEGLGGTIWIESKRTAAFIKIRRASPWIRNFPKTGPYVLSYRLDPQRRRLDGRQTTLKDLLEDEIKDLYSAEKQLTKAIPKMAKGSHDAALRLRLRTT